ncbi:type II secretion system major pseudopilin GspG [Caulobacter mirabilis]|uniref:type II secretion system major pseudopilin GspG n=1 Tax=Caulobacter mirabilis TaxID=69666 RepID=UPI001FE7A18D|nr:type II secretion system major pseudopilin GspG [Caulobacter mirabilis]
MNREDGYTLTEMLVVIGIIGLIAAVLTPTLIGQLGRARAKSAQLQVEMIASQVEMFRSDTSRYPTAQEGLQALVAEPADAEGWTGPYMRDARSLKDPWGRPLEYAPTADGLSFAVRSLGSDGKKGGSGAARDLSAPAG